MRTGPLPGVPDLARGCVRLCVEGAVCVFAAASGSGEPAAWLPLVVALVAGDADAPVMPAAAPAVATAPAIIVAPSSFEMFMVEPPGVACLQAMLGHAAKRGRTRLQGSRAGLLRVRRAGATPVTSVYASGADVVDAHTMVSCVAGPGAPPMRRCPGGKRGLR